MVLSISIPVSHTHHLKNLLCIFRFEINNPKGLEFSFPKMLRLPPIDFPEKIDFDVLDNSKVSDYQTLVDGFGIREGANKSRSFSISKLYHKHQ